MTPLRQRMLQDMRLRGLAASTQKIYLGAVARLASFYGRSPEELSEGEIRDYFVHLIIKRRLSPPSVTIALCAIKFFYERSLERKWPIFELVRPAREKKLPIVLDHGEVCDILGKVRLPNYRACLIATYTCGLRIHEATAICPTAIDKQRMTLRLRGKGNKDRYVPLPDATLAVLRRYWKSHRSPTWMFPSLNSGRKASKSPEPTRPISHASVRLAFYQALRQSSVRKAATVHSLRHSYATNLLEAGVDIRVLQAYLGHANLRTTNIYTHLTRKLHQAALEPIHRLARDLDNLSHPS